MLHRKFFTNTVYYQLVEGKICDELNMGEETKCLHNSGGGFSLKFATWKEHTQWEDNMKCI